MGIECIIGFRGDITDDLLFLAQRCASAQTEFHEFYRRLHFRCLQETGIRRQHTMSERAIFLAYIMIRFRAPAARAS